MCLSVYIAFSLGNFNSSTYEGNITELVATRLIE